MAELANKDKVKAEGASTLALRAEESLKGELKHYKPTQQEQQQTEQIVAENTDQKITSQNHPANIPSPTEENIRTASPHLDEDTQQRLISDSHQKQDLQKPFKQLEREHIDLLTQLEQLSLTDSGLVTDDTVTHWPCDTYYMQNLGQTGRMKSALKSQRSTSPFQQSPVKGGTSESELMRVLRERDEMKSMLEKYERHLSEIQANVRVLTTERDKTRLHYQQAQEDLADLRREVLRSKAPLDSKYSSKAQSILKHLEKEREEAISDFHHMSTERDSLRERLKISQETAINERAHLEQKVEDLQNALLTLEQQRVEQKVRQVQMRDSMMGLDEQVNTLSRKLIASEGELSCLKNECNLLRLSSSQTENTLTETQMRLINMIRDIQRLQKKNEQLYERNDSLLKEETVLKEELNVLQSTVSELNQERDFLQEQLERKSVLLCSTNKELDDKENSIHYMKLQIVDLEASLKASKETISSRDQELETMRRKMLDSGDELNAVLKHKDATLRDNTQLRDELDRMRLDNKALQFRVNEATHEIEVLERKVQNYVSNISSMEDLLYSKDQECKGLQECRMQLRTSDSEKHRLKERVYSLESSLKESLIVGQSCSAEIRQLRSTLDIQKEELRQIQSQNIHIQQDLAKTRDLCIKTDTNKEAVQQEVESCRSELELLGKQLEIERKKDLHAQLTSHERLVQIQLLRDKLTLADSKASTQSREIAQLRTRSSLLEADLEATRRQLNIEHDEREHAVKELFRHGLSPSFCSPILSSTQRPAPTLVCLSLSPHKFYSPDRSHLSTTDHLQQRRLPDRSV